MAITLYRYPGPYAMHGDHFDYITCEPPTVEARIQEGWFHSPTDAKAAAERAAAKKQPMEKAEPKQQQNALKVKISERLAVAERLKN